MPVCSLFLSLLKIVFPQQTLKIHLSRKKIYLYTLSLVTRISQKQDNRAKERCLWSGASRMFPPRSWYFIPSVAGKLVANVPTPVLLWEILIAGESLFVWRHGPS